MSGPNRTVVLAAAWLGACVALSAPSAGLAQRVESRSDSGAGGAGSYGSAYLSLGHWAYDYIDLLIARGRITSLPPLVRPYRRIDVAAAVLQAETEGQLSRTEMEWTEALREELAEEVELLRDERTQGVGMGGEFAVGAHAMTHTHRDPLRPEGEEKLFFTMRLDVRGEAPMVAGAVRARWDNHYLNDPQFPDGRVIERRQCDPIVQECAYRSEEAYIELQLPYVRLSFGRLYRNWGLWTQDGLLLGDYAYSYDHIGYRFGNDRIALSGLYAPLSDFGGDTARHFSSHRFDWLIRDNLAVAIGESVVYGGANRRIDFNLTNPVGLWEISGNPEGTERNALGMIEAWWRIFDDLVTYGGFMVDNTSVGDEGRSEGFSQYAGALGVQLPSLTGSFALKADLTVVSSLAYRSRVARWEYYAVDNLGLAQDKIDAIVVALQGDWYLARPSGLLLQPRLDLMWKGEDDLADDWPDDAFTGRDRILIGTVEKTIRPSLRGRWSHATLDARWDLGLNLIKNQDHVTRDWEVEFVGMIWAEARIRF